ncbi:Lipid A core O-antigen ligase related enzyme [Prochlorococcus sp. MIT 0601]|nr:Lipid A core O-antigen ligase related enzyme [Prochlorococcus sp. MIT 0601]
MVIGSYKAYSGWLAWVGLANWIPFFWCFWGFQPYLLTRGARKRSSLLLLAGTFPVLLTGFGQIWFGWQGPWQFLYGLIIWFIDFGGNPNGRLSGLFNYANIAGSWLAIIWPFALAFLINSSATFRNRIVSFAFTIATAIAVFLTDSRNAWAAIFIAIPFVLGPSSWFWLLPLLSAIFLLLLFSAFPVVPLELQLFARRIIPEDIWTRLNDFKYMNNRPIEATRIYQWKEAINLFLQRPWLGYGAAAFSVLYPLRQGIWHGHAHNLPLELLVAHGIPVAILVVGFVLLLLIISSKNCNFFGDLRNKSLATQNLFDRAWWTAAFILVFLHGADMPFFDSRINLAGWILLSGLRCMLIPTNSFKKLGLSSFDDGRLVP